MCAVDHLEAKAKEFEKVPPLKSINELLPLKLLSKSYLLSIPAVLV